MRMRFASAQTNDEERAVDFWVNKLGFQLLFDHPTDWGGRFLAFVPPRGGTWFVMSKPVPGIPAKVGGFSNIAWETEDVEGTYEALKAKGVHFTQPPTHRFWGGVEARFQDPDGNEFLLQQDEA